MTPTITISKEAYDSLLKEKLPHESFTDVILRLTRRFGKIFESFGKWNMSDEEETIMKTDLKIEETNQAIKQLRNDFGILKGKRKSEIKKNTTES